LRTFARLRERLLNFVFTLICKGTDMRYLVRRHTNADDDDDDVEVVWQFPQSERYEKEVALNENLSGDLLTEDPKDKGGGYSCN